MERENDSFSNFKNEMEAGVTEMKKEGEKFIKEMNDNFVAFKRSFMLTPDSVIKIVGNRVDESAINDSLKADFTDFKDFAGDLLD